MRRFGGDERGVTVQIGAILLFGILVLALATYQAVAVPAQNGEVEFNHNQRVQSDMLELRSAVLDVGTGERFQSTPVELGTTYPSRVLLINPPPPSGRLSTGPERTAAFRNLTATENETADYLNTSENGAYNLTTRDIEYRPGYNVYGGAPTTTVQAGTTVNEFPEGGPTAISGQTLVRGNDLFLVALAGSLSRAQSGTVTVEPRTLSAATRSTTVRNTTAGNLTLVVPTALSAERWEDLLGDEYDPGFDSTRSHVYDVSDVPGRDAVALSLDGGVTYRLRTALVGVGRGGTVPEPAYLTVVDGEGDVTVEVRDRYNNPVANSRVPDDLTVNVTEGRGVVRQVRLPVGEDGRASFDATGSGDVNLTLENESGPLLDAANGSVAADIEAGTTPVNGGDPLPPDAVAFDDANGNGRYDIGEETYTEKEFDAYRGNVNGDFGDQNIVVETDISVTKLDVSAGSFVANDVEIRINNQGNAMKITTQRQLDLRGSTLRGGNGGLSLKASQSAPAPIDIRHTSLVFKSGGLSASTPGGELRFNGAPGGVSGTQIRDLNGNGRTLTLSSGTKAGEDGPQPEVGTIS
jgi:hypothetical protein